MKKKVAVIGIGDVGKAVDFSIVNQGICDELVLVNHNREKADGYAHDLMHSLEFMPRNIHIHAGEYQDCADANIVVLAISGGTTSYHRDSLLESACKAVKPIVLALKESGFNGIYLIITNPVDAISNFVWRLSGLPKNQVIGTGTSLDSARLKFYLGHYLKVSPKYINAFVMGEHGESQFIPWSCASVLGKPLPDIVREHPEIFPEDFYNFMPEKVKSCAAAVFYSVGSTSCGVASAAVAIIRAILQDEDRIIAVSTNLTGHFGVTDDIFAGVPCIVNSCGVRELIEVELDKADSEKLEKTLSAIRSQIVASQQWL